MTGLGGAIAILQDARDHQRRELFTVEYALRQLEAISQVCSRCGGPRAKWASSVCRACYTNQPVPDGEEANHE